MTLGGYVIIGDGSGTTLTTSDSNQVGTLAAPILAGVDPLGDHGGSSASCEMGATEL